MISSTDICLGTRGSPLALAQTHWVRDELARLQPNINVHIEVIKTTGDKLKTAPLALIGGQGVFTKELEEALLERRIDVAVHSLKDLPTVTPKDLTIAAFPTREDARDALVLPTNHTFDAPSLATLPRAASVGTSSLRRAAQLLYVRPDLQIKELRGNVDTRLRKLDAGEYDAIILAAAGLRRLGLSERISSYLTPIEMLPAIGQGALGLECRADDERTINLLSPLDDARTRAACIAERSLLRTLGGGCQLPIAGHALVYLDVLHLQGLVANTSGTHVVRSSSEGALQDAARIGETLARDLLIQGAEGLLSPAIL